MPKAHGSFLGKDGIGACFAAPRGLGRSAEAFAALALARASRSARPPVRGSATLPDLLDLLAARGVAGPDAEDARAFRGLLASSADSCAIGRCCVDEDGTYAVAVYAHPRNGPRVSRGDEFYGGVQLSGHLGTGAVRAEPHVLRLVCTNGAVIGVGTAGSVYERPDRASPPRGDLASVVGAGMSGALVPRAQVQLRCAAIVPLVMLRAALPSLRLRLPVRIGPEIRDAQRAEPPTVYGLYNAMTRVARDHASLRDALGLERAAGSLLALLETVLARRLPARAGAPV